MRGRPEPKSIREVGRFFSSIALQQGPILSQFRKKPSSKIEFLSLPWDYYPKPPLVTSSYSGCLRLFILQLRGRSLRTTWAGTSPLDSVGDSKPCGQKMANFCLLHRGMALPFPANFAAFLAGLATAGLLFCRGLPGLLLRQGGGGHWVKGRYNSVPAFLLLRVGAESICKSICCCALSGRHCIFELRMVRSQ